MAGMFYSLKETAEKLGKTEGEVRKLAEAGTLRLFRDGSNLLFKIDEVNALAGERLDGDLGPELEPAEPGTDIFTDAQLPDAKEPTEEELMLDLGEEEPAAEAEPAAEPQVEAEIKPAAEEAESTSELGLAPEEDKLAGAIPEEDLLADITEEGTAAPAGEQPKEEAKAEEDISLASESGLAAGSDITDMDTALTGEGVNVLAGTGAGEETAGDSSAETVAPAGTSTEASLEEIEEDVNLDSFGSGSGLLDLSLQADDTSLGGILDEIYTSEGGEEGKAAAAAAAAGSVEDISAEADHVTSDTTELASAPEAVMPMTAVATTTFMEVAPDKASNLLGGLLFLPLLALLYATIVAWAAMDKVIPSILEPIKGIIWIVVGIAILVTAGVAGFAFASGRERAPKAAKPVVEKVKKEQPAKKEKAAKKEAAEPAKKEAKPKKSLFGKKK